nr:PAS domain-containing protein [uncultured Acetatifactor sp.]
MGDIWGFFENINEIVYVADIETYELIYMNRKAMEVFGVGSLAELEGRPCYQILRGGSSPCSFCNGCASDKGCFEQQYYHRQMDRHFLLRSTFLTKDGRRCRLEMALDISDAEQQKTMVQSVQNLEAIINEGLRVALLEETPDQSLEVLLAYLGKALQGGSIYLRKTRRAATTIPTSGRLPGCVRRRRTSRMCRRKSAPAGIGISASAGISSSMTWRISGSATRSSTRT